MELISSAAAGGDFSDGGDSTTGDRTLGNVGNHDLGLLTNNTNRFHIQGDGLIGVGTTSQSALFDIVGSTDIVQLSVKAHSSQNANIAEFYNAGGTLVSAIDERGVPECTLGIDNNTLYIGTGAGRAASSGSSNTGIGATTLDSCTTGQYNVALGSGALGALTEGDDNIGIGRASMGVLTTGESNTAIGQAACQSLTIGTQNFGLGYQALGGNVTGSGNVAIGYQAIKGAYSGTDHPDSNVAIGKEALWSLSTGQSNIGIGQGAGRVITTALNNVCIGGSAGLATTGSNGVFIGRSAGNNTTGGSNTFIGYEAGYGITSGTQNVIIGNDVGYRGHGNPSNTFMLGSGWVGTGSQEPYRYCLYGYMGSDPDTQWLRHNGSFEARAYNMLSYDGAVQTYEEEVVTLVT